MVTRFEMNIPDTIMRVLGANKKNIDRVLKQELALHYFEKKRLTFGQARELANLSTWEFLDLLRERKIPLHYELEELEEDLETIERIAHE